MAQTVLIVDDVKFVRKTLAEILKSAHYQVIAEAENGKEALQLYIQHRPDLVTMDVVMPGMSGIEATQQIVKADKDARVIMVSAMGQENLIMDAIAAGAKDYIMKPFSEKEVIKAVNHALHSGDGIADRSTFKENIGG